MGRSKAVVEDLLDNLPGVVHVQSSPSQSQPKPKRVKKARAKAIVTQVDSEDTVPISKLAEIKKSSTAAEKSLAEAEPSDTTRSKKPRSKATANRSAFKVDEPWVPAIMVGDRPIKASNSAIDSIEVGVALSTVVLLPTDLNPMAEITEYKNFALMMQHSVLTKEATGFLSSLNNIEAKIKGLIDQAKAAKAAQDTAEERADAAEAVAEVLKVEAKEAEAKTTDAKTVEVKAELQEALATKEVEIKVADEKAFSEGDINQLQVPFLPSPKDSEDEAKDEDVETDNADEEEAATGANPPL
ncbi:uncharacterized protein LOC114283088 [Camellia sinensis]|uniref:uncharacterized protein LOC114283088 n=1 Tax=Camellia sinensis TaxID=4442 RepID=UPI001036E875|nr:uncharacterized protein LOC114283088 [Camellia sinensis]